MRKYKTKKDFRQRRHFRIRKKISGTAERPRLSVFFSGKHIYSQLIDDESGKTLLFVSSVGKANAQLSVKSNLDGAKKIGKITGEKAVSAGINTVVFDRGGFKYHGKIKAFADAAREAGLKF
ncbi:MAG TPA: 50S ribosomal protein L18 [Victivallales bacterium]|nr:50S ribosomal protein L18 [Victivallales bacterium]HRU01058.1 50S ribosomal protein L18 [Victivallales bacterium]